MTDLTETIRGKDMPEEILDIMNMPDLISAEQICTKLGISRSTLDRLRSGSGSRAARLNARISVLDGIRTSPSYPRGLTEYALSPFPEPIMNLGGYKWAVKDVNQWLNANKQALKAR